MDTNDDGSLSFVEFVRAARRIHFSGNLKRIFHELCNDDEIMTPDCLDPSLPAKLARMREERARSSSPTKGSCQQGPEDFTASARRKVAPRQGSSSTDLLRSPSWRRHIFTTEQTHEILVTLAERPYPFPSRTRKSSSPAPKILRGQPLGKIGRRRGLLRCPGESRGGSAHGPVVVPRCRTLLPSSP